MEQLVSKKAKDFSTRKVSLEQAIRVLGRNGIKVSKEKATIILDFLYLIARTYRNQNDEGLIGLEPQEKVEL